MLEAAVTGASRLTEITNTAALHLGLRRVAARVTNLYVPLLSMTSSPPAVRQRCSEHLESGAAGERPHLENFRSQWDAEGVRVPPASAFQYSAPPRVLTRRHLTWRSTLIAVFCAVYLLRVCVCARARGGGRLLGIAHGVPIYLLLATNFQGVGWTQVKQTARLIFYITPPYTDSGENRRGEV